MADENKVSVMEIKKTADGIGAPSDAAQINHADTGTIIALLKGILKQLQGAGTGAAPVQLTGRNIEEIAIVNAVALTDTSTKTSPSIDVSKYKEFEVKVINTLRDASGSPVAVNIGFQVSGAALGVVKKDGTVMPYTAAATSGSCWHEVPSTGNTARVFFLSMLPIKSTSPISESDVSTMYPYKLIRGVFSFSYKAKTTPVDGSITISIMGVPN